MLMITHKGWHFTGDMFGVYTDFSLTFMTLYSFAACFFDIHAFKDSIVELKNIHVGMRLSGSCLSE